MGVSVKQGKKGLQGPQNSGPSFFPYCRVRQCGLESRQYEASLADLSVYDLL